MALLADVVVKRLFVAHGSHPAIGHHHGLGLPAQLVQHMRAKVLHDDHHFLRNAGRVQLRITKQPGRGLALLHRLVVPRLLQLEGKVIRGVAAQYVQNELLLDGLAHGIHMKRRRCAVRTDAPKQLQRLGLGRGREGVVRHVGRALARRHPLVQDVLLRQLRVLLRCCNGLVVATRFGQLCACRRWLPRRGQHLAQLYRALARLAGMRLVQNQGKASIGQPAHLAQHPRKLLQSGDDDELALVQRLRQLRTVLVDALHHALLVVKLVNRVLQLRIEHAPVGNHDHAAEHFCILRIVQRCQPVRQPANGVGFARARRMLHQIGLPHALIQSGRHQAIDCIPLVVARKQKRCLEALLALLILVFTDLRRQELAHHRQPGIALQHLVPQVARGVAQHIIGRIARTRTAQAIRRAPVERQEARGQTRQLRAHAHLVAAHGKVHQRPLAKRQQRLGLLAGRIHGRAVVQILAHRVLDVLRGVGFQLDRGQRQAIQKQHQVNAALVVQRVMQLAHCAQAVLLVMLPGLGVLPIGGRELRHLEAGVDVLEALAQHVQRAP